MGEEHKHIDQLIRDKMLGYEEQPPAHIWAAMRPNRTAMCVKGALATLMLMVASAVAYMWWGQNDAQQDNPMEQSAAADNTVPKEPAATPTVVPIQESAPAAQPQTDKGVGKELRQQPVRLKQVVEPVAQQLAETPPKPPIVTRENRWPARPSVDIAALSPIWHSLTPPLLATMQLPLPKSPLRALHAGVDYLDKQAERADAKAKRNKTWSIGVELSPEWTKLQESKTTIQSYGIDFSVNKYWRHLYLASGLGLSYSTDDGKYRVDYKKSMYKGSYQHVDWVSFEINDEDDVLPIYHTHKVDVYDTVDKLRVGENDNTYLYLNIPLYVGYERSIAARWHVKGFAGIRSGILIYRDIPKPTLEDNVFLVHTLYNDRKDFYMQGQIGVGIHYQLHQRWDVGLSPNLSYYFSSPIRNEQKKPYAWGLRFGLRYKLLK